MAATVPGGMGIEIREFLPEDHASAFRLWESSDGVGLSDADSRENIVRFLARNPALSFVAVGDRDLVGTILVGHDGRRGLIHHLVVASSERRRGVGRALVRRGLSALSRAGIAKCHLLVFRENDEARGFWTRIGAEERVELATFSLMTEPR